MQRHEGEEKPLVGFDVAKIAARMKGWELRQPHPEKDDWFVLARQHEGKHLVFGMNPKKGYVHFRENVTGGPLFSASCRNITYVYFRDNEVTFQGNVVYEVSFNGQFHDIKPDFNEDSIATRSYEFPDSD